MHQALCQAGFRGKPDTAQHSQSSQTSREKGITLFIKQKWVCGRREARPSKGLGEEGGVPKAKRDPLSERVREVAPEDVAVN